MRRPKKEGGLGVLSLKTHNEALLLKLLHKFLNKGDIPRSASFGKAITENEESMETQEKPHFGGGMAIVQIMDGKTL